MKSPLYEEEQARKAKTPRSPPKPATPGRKEHGGLKLVQAKHLKELENRQAGNPGGIHHPRGEPNRLPLPRAFPSPALTRRTIRRRSNPAQICSPRCAPRSLCVECGSGLFQDKKDKMGLDAGLPRPLPIGRRVPQRAWRGPFLGTPRLPSGWRSGCQS